MAVRTPTFPRSGLTTIDQVLWEGLATGDTGLPVKFAKFSDKSVHIYGTFSGGTTVVLQGSNDPRANPDHADHASAVWTGLTDAQGNAISVTAAAIEQVLENPLWIRPSVASGSSDSITVSLVGKKTP